MARSTSIKISNIHSLKSVDGYRAEVELDSRGIPPFFANFEIDILDKTKTIEEMEKHIFNQINSTLKEVANQIDLDNFEIVQGD